MIKVRIDKCSSILSWYTDQVGSELHVRETGFDGKYSFGDTEYLINKSDCTVILDDTDQEENEFVLPEKWCIKQNLDQRICDWHRGKFDSNANLSGSYRYLLNDNYKKYSIDIPIGYTEITQDQFFAHVWEKELKKEEPKGWTPQFGEWGVILLSGVYDSDHKKCDYDVILKVGVPYPIEWYEEKPSNINCLSDFQNGVVGIGGTAVRNDYRYIRKALPNEIPQLEPKDYCIKRTPENAEVLNRWANSLKNSVKDQFWGTFDFMCFDLERAHAKTNIEGFTELHTVEEFFAKVGYTPEHVVQKTTEYDYVSSVNEEHEEKLCNMEIAGSIAGFKFTRKDLDMLVSIYDLVLEYGGNLDLDTITDTQFKVNSRHDSTI